MHHAVQECHVGAQFLTHVKVGLGHQLNFSRIGDHQFGTFLFGPENPGRHQGMARRGIASDHKNTFRILYFVDGIGHGTTSERCGKTCHSGGVSKPGAVVHVIGPHRGASKFLKQIILLIGDLGRGEKRDGIAALRFLDAFQLGHRIIQGLIP